MPKVRPLTRLERTTESLGADLRVLMARNRLTSKETAKLCGIAQSTFYNKMKNPEKLTAHELARIAAATHTQLEITFKEG